MLCLRISGAQIPEGRRKAMAVQTFGPYSVGLGFGDLFMPGEVRGYTIGPWPDAQNGEVSISVHPHLFQSEASITLESITARVTPTFERFIDCSYRNTGVGGLKGWHLYVSLAK